MPNRTITLREGEDTKGPVVYWMSRDQRVHDNWALLYAISIANQQDVPLYVIFCLASGYPSANLRHYQFMISGLSGVGGRCNELGAHFRVLLGSPTETIPSFIAEVGASYLVSDFDSLRIKQQWKESINTAIRITHLEVDAHNIIPCRSVSDKREFGAYTLRPKIKKLLPQYLIEFPHNPTLKRKASYIKTDWAQAMTWLNPDSSVKPVRWIVAGEEAACKSLSDFIEGKLSGYSLRRNNPLLDGQSGLSPYLHFGQLSAQRVAIEVLKSSAPQVDKDAFLDELIVRRELSDNFCFYTPRYDTTDGFHPWAAATHKEHRKDEREYLYNAVQFENGFTHDPLWNASQSQMVNTGKMHGFLRMYWAKKILEWTPSPEEAMRIAIYLNDKYSLDGRDPNGYAGIAWSIGGVHDRAWAERPIFGKIRYMNYNGCKRKFDVDDFIESQRTIG